MDMELKGWIWNRIDGYGVGTLVMEFKGWILG